MILMTVVSLLVFILGLIFLVSSCHWVDWHHSVCCLLLLSLNLSTLFVYSVPVALFFSWLVSLPTMFLAIPIFCLVTHLPPPMLALTLWSLPLLFISLLFLCSPFPLWQRKLDQSGLNEPLQAPKTPTLISLSDSGRVLKEPLVAPRHI